MNCNSIMLRYKKRNGELLCFEVAIQADEKKMQEMGFYLKHRGESNACTMMTYKHISDLPPSIRKKLDFEKGGEKEDEKC